MEILFERNHNKMFKPHFVFTPTVTYHRNQFVCLYLFFNFFRSHFHLHRWFPFVIERISTAGLACDVPRKSFRSFLICITASRFLGIFVTYSSKKYKTFFSTFLRFTSNRSGWSHRYEDRIDSTLKQQLIMICC